MIALFKDFFAADPQNFFIKATTQMEDASSPLLQLDGAAIITQAVPAAVLIPLIERENGIHILFTKRSESLTHHPGQISFPGGRIDPRDKDETAAALREMEEEIGHATHKVEIIGSLPHYFTGTGFQIRPFLGHLSPPFAFKANQEEVAEIFEVPLEVLLRKELYQLEHLEWKGIMRSYYSLNWQDYRIWGATAGILMMLRHSFEAYRQTQIK